MTQRGYLLDDDHERGRVRLSLVERLEDPATIALLERLGVVPGWRCLEVGAGHGSIAEWLTTRVGRAGRVVATDVDTIFLEERGLAGLEVRRHDLVRDELEREAFHLVHARHVLVHIPEREAVLRKLARALRPGGVLLIEEPDIATDGPDPSASEQDRETYARVAPEIHGFLAARGLGLRTGARMYGWMRAIGLEDVSAEGRIRTFRGGDPAARSPHMLAFRDLAPALVTAGGVGGKDLAAFLALADDPGFAWRESLTIATWGRRSRRTGAARV